MPAEPLAIHYPDDLPVSGRRDDILAALREHQVVVVAGATGSGKTTQLPKMLLELGKGRIAHTQPRRIAARAVAERVAAELGVELGGAVGYRVRFTDQASRDSRLVVMTDGILLNEIHRDPQLRRYDAVIIDEAHERSLTVDFLLGYLRRLLPRRPDLTVVVTSATIDPGSFARHFGTNAGPAPVIEVSGRTYPVEVRYRPLVADGEAEDTDSEDRDTVTAVLDALAELAAEPPGDVLVFLSGESEIRDVLDAVTGADLPGTEVLPLYGRLSAAEQHRVFEPGRAPGIRRRVILATNVAETSLTVPGIRYVVDAGTARISRWSARSKVQRLPIEAISQASAAQRAGRSGREAPGIAIRLYAEADFAGRPEFTEPEIRRTDLAAVLLQMAVLGLGDIADFPFLDPPDRRGVRDGLALLTELGAIDRDGEVTRLGHDLARLPLDPRLGRMLLAARELGVLDDVLPIVAGLSIQDPRERPEAAREQAEQAHRRHVDPTSDFVTLLRLWRHLEAEQAARSGSAFRRMLRSEFLSYLRVREWQDVVRQLRIALDLPRRPAPTGDAPAVDADRIHQAILAGLLSRIGIRDDRGEAKGRGDRAGGRPTPRRRQAEYLGARGSRFAIHPGSALARRAPDAVMSAELVETSRLYARMNAAIDPAWAERWAGDLLVRSVAEPRWDRRRGEAVADEKVTLYGVPIVPRRRIRFARVDPGYARELFIRHALVAGEWDVSRVARRLTDFHRRNAELREHLEDLQDRERRRDLLLGEEALVAWYRARVPGQVDSTREFERWWRREREVRPELLTMREEDFLDPEADEPASREAGYPDRWTHGGLDLALEYRHAPGAADDGVTLVIPAADRGAALELLDAVDADAIDWLIPGMREELVAGWIRTLPKVLRREVVPAGDWARRIVPELPDEPEGRLGDALAAIIKRLTFAPVTRHDFELDRLPDHLRMNARLVDARGRTIAAGRDLAALRARLVAAAPDPARSSAAPGGAHSSPDPAGPDLSRSLPRVHQLAEGASSESPPGQVGAPSAAGGGGSTGGSGSGSGSTAGDGAPPAAVQALIKYAMEHLTDAERLQLATSPYRSVPALLADCVAASGGPGAAPDEVFQTVGLVAEVLGAAREVDRAIRATTSLALVGPLRDARAQLDALLHPAFVLVAGRAQLQRYPAYLAGLAHRVARLPEQAGRDRVWQGEVENATRLYLEAGGTLPLEPGLRPELVRVRWLLEELRLSLFAQHLPTAEPVSLQRIRRTLAEL